MQSLNLLIFSGLGAGFSPVAWLLQVALWTSMAATWCIVAMLAWVTFREPAAWVDVLVALACAGLVALVSHTMAQWLDMPRPFVLGLSADYASHSARGGMPSTHASVMSAVATFMLWRPRLHRMGLMVSLLALATGFARIYAGIHFPFDILGGFALGSVCGTLAAGTAMLLARRADVPPSSMTTAATDRLPSGDA